MPIPPWLRQHTDLFLFDDMKIVAKPLTVGGIKVLIGQFFEVLTAKLFNGTHSVNETGWEVYPDVVIWGNNCRDIIIESKASHTSIVIDSKQYKFYKKLIGTEFPFNDPIIYYVLYIHSLKDIKKTYNDTIELTNALCKSVEMCLAVPIEYMDNFIGHLTFRPYGFKGYGSRGEGCYEPKRKRLREWIHNNRMIKEDLSISCKINNGRVVPFKIMDKYINSFDITVVGDLPSNRIKERQHA